MDDLRNHEHAKIGPAQKVVTGWRRSLPVCIYRTAEGWRIRVFPLLAVCWTLNLAAITYLATGTALYLNDRYRSNLKEVSLWDRIYPPRWEDYRVARGNSMIQNGREALEHNNLAGAAHLLRAGLARNPANASGRELLADIYRFVQRADLAENVLLEGLRPGNFSWENPVLLHRTVSFLFQRQRDQTIIDLTGVLLEPIEGASAPPPEQRFLALARANAFFYRGNFDQSEATLQKFGLRQTPDGRILSSRIEWERGFPELALVLMEQLAREFPDHPEVYHWQVKWLAESGETGRARQLSLLRRIDRPAEIRPRLDLLHALDLAGDHAAVTAESEAMLQSFADSAEPLLLLGDFAANSGRPAIADRAFEVAQTRRFSTGGLALMRVEARIVAGLHQEAVDLSHTLLSTHPDWSASLAPVFNGLQAIAHFALGDRESADLYLNDFLNQRDLRAENLVAVSKRFLAVGAPDRAHRILNQAVEHDPNNQPALTALVEFELGAPDAPDLISHLTRLLEMRRPSPKLLRAAYDTLGRDRYVFLAGRDELIHRITRSLSGPARNLP